MDFMDDTADYRFGVVRSEQDSLIASLTKRKKELESIAMEAFGEPVIDSLRIPSGYAPVGSIQLTRADAASMNTPIDEYEYKIDALRWNMEYENVVSSIRRRQYDVIMCRRKTRDHSLLSVAPSMIVVDHVKDECCAVSDTGMSLL